jgi:hypothetical protein
MLELNELHALLPAMIEDGLADVEEAADVDLAGACEQLCVLYRASGITALLLELDVDQYYHMLTRSALTRIYALERMPPAVKDQSRDAKLTRSRAFFDAVAATRPDLAKRIGVLGAQRWMERYEYEDDYCYALFVHKLVEGADRSTLEPVLARLKVAAAGSASVNPAVCEALLARDSESFAAAFADKLRSWEEELAFQETSISRDDVAFAGDRHVYIEGVALLRLAEGLGIATEEEYRFCPRETRMTMEAAFPDDGYPR